MAHAGYWQRGTGRRKRSTNTAYATIGQCFVYTHTANINIYQNNNKLIYAINAFVYQWNTPTVVMMMDVSKALIFDRND